MMSLFKYLSLLEELKFTEHGDSEALNHNLAILRKYIKESPLELLKTIAEDTLRVPHLLVGLQLEEKPARHYIAYLQHVLLHIVDHTNFESDAKEDLLSTRHLNICVAAVQDLASLALHQQLHPQLRTAGGVFAESTSAATPNYRLLHLSIECFARLLPIKQLQVAHSMELVARDYMAAILSLQLASELGEYALTELEASNLRQRFQVVWLHVSKLQYFRNILLLKATPQLPAKLQQKLHIELLTKLKSPDGFATLVATLQVAAQQRPNDGDKRIVEVVAHIVAHRGHSAAFQNGMLQQSFAFAQRCLQSEVMLPSLSVALLCLRRLHDLSEANQQWLRQKLDALMEQLTAPRDLLSGLIVMEHAEICQLIALLYELFCTSSVECLPSALLVAYLPLLLQLHQQTPPICTQQQRQLASLVTRCLDNRTQSNELETIVEQLYTGKFPCDWRPLHPRLQLTVANAELRVLVAHADYRPEFGLSQALPALLMSADHNLLTYRVFSVLLRLWLRHGGDQSSDDLLSSEEELVDFLNAKYPLKVELLISLNTLVAHAPLKQQIVAHAKEFLCFLRDIIERHITASSGTASNENLLLLLTLAQELLQSAPLLPAEHSSSFTPTLQRLQRQPQLSPLLQQRVAALLALLNGGGAEASCATDPTTFQTARALIESPESHLQVYGIELLLAQLRRRDPCALANAHVIVALALNTLKSPESYTFLNCVRLFVALVQHVSEKDACVLELLADEYQSETASIDYRLVVGEALLKVGKELGPLVYKHKATLLNCFMAGARSPHGEFRMSAYANLAQLCRTLCYQVHSHFHELLQLINGELSTTAHALPAKRAAVLVLSELLEGMDNLLDFGEMLLPIYRLLKQLQAAPAPNDDERLRTHAANGLKALNEKCAKLFLPGDAAEAPLHKQIQIRGIKASQPAQSGSLKSLILEMN